MKTIFITIFLCIMSLQISNAQWELVNIGMGNVEVRSLAVNGNNIFAGVFGTGGGVYLSTNNGLIWTLTSLSNQSVYSLAVNGNNIFAGTVSNGVYLSTNSGTNWTQTSLNNQTIYKLAVNGNNIFAGTYNPNNGLFLSTDNGATWTQTSLNNLHITSLAVNGNNIFAGSGTGNGVNLSTNNGITWSQTSFIQSAYALAINANNIFVGSIGVQGVFMSTNNGSTWTQTSLNNQNVYSLTVNANYIFAGTSTNGVYVSNDNGATWTQKSEGLPNGSTLVRDFSFLNNYIFAGLGFGGLNGVYRRPIGELTGIKPISNEVPNKFSLSQNYPNPFNPSTKIKFALPNSSFAKLVVYDALGRELETLVNEQLNAGTYEANWIASNYPSGVYFYTLTSGDYSETSKMILIK